MGHDTERADRPALEADQEIEITPEMIEAGASVIYEVLDDGYEPPLPLSKRCEIARGVFSAMLPLSQYHRSGRSSRGESSAHVGPVSAGDGEIEVTPEMVEAGAVLRDLYTCVTH